MPRLNALRTRTSLKGLTVLFTAMPHWPVMGVSWTATLSPSCFDGLNLPSAEVEAIRKQLGAGEIAELDVGASGADGRRAHRGLRTDEEFVAVEIGAVLDE